MGLDRYTKNLGPAKPHLSKGEVADLRSDMGEAFKALAGTLAGHLVVKMGPSPDVSGGVSAGSAEFQLLEDAGGDPITEEVVVEFAVFDDEDLAVPAANAALGTAAVGTIVAGSGSAALKVKTDATGLFRCTLSNAVDETVWLGCSGSFKSPALDTRDTVDVTFSA